MVDDYPDVWVVLKDGDSHGTKHGTPLTVDLDERIAHYRKCGPCVRYIPAARAERALAALAAISMLDGSREWARTVARAGADGTRHPGLCSQTPCRSRTLMAVPELTFSPRIAEAQRPT